jgi:hypothetical protein
MTSTEEQTTTKVILKAAATTLSPENSIWKKPARLSPDGMGVIIPQSLVELFHIDDDQTWLQMIPTDQGLLMKPVNGMPSSEKEN